MEDLITENIMNEPIPSKIKEDFGTAAVWARLGAILAFVGVGLNLIQNIKNGGIFGAFISAAINVTISIFLLNFGTQTKRGVDATDQENFEEGLNSLRRYFKITVILTIIAAVFIIIWLAIQWNSLTSYYTQPQYY